MGKIGSTGSIGLCGFAGGFRFVDACSAGESVSGVWAGSWSVAGAGAAPVEAVLVAFVGACSLFGVYRRVIILFF